MLGFSPWFSATLFDTITAVMSFIGLGLGRMGPRLIRIRPDLLSGAALIIMAVVLAFD